MNEYVAFVRAINVGGRSIVRMTDLRDAFVAAGCERVRTCIQSGNVVFESPDKDSSALFARIRNRIGSLADTPPGVSFRTMSELERLVRAAPFTEFESDPLIKLYVVFLAEKPRVKPKLPLLLPKEALEAFGMKNLDVFMVSRRKPNGFYGFPNNFIEKELGVAGTTRNWTTVTKVHEFARKA